MPTYPVIHKETKEKKELHMTMKEYSQWREENSDWDKDWSAGVCGSGEVGDANMKGEANSNGWNEILDRASRQPGSNVRKNRTYY
ncbi:hypothetical protein CMO86_09885 [Candidatus Woesearchaeota archaeon]|jgi:hypothetical protein|nr:hypothetical protein [Candidatus Woesearchaeota archaeon]|tara:strand:- start:545 stop:799 length:255 start_codon:yes stop_codon:yes gene_type:complete